MKKLDQGKGIRRTRPRLYAKLMWDKDLLFRDCGVNILLSLFADKARGQRNDRICTGMTNCPVKPCGYVRALTNRRANAKNRMAIHTRPPFRGARRL
jgi:hypothetical protein